MPTVRHCKDYKEPSKTQEVACYLIYDNAQLNSATATGMTSVLIVIVTVKRYLVCT